jgi:hypothetical protein
VSNSSIANGSLESKDIPGTNGTIFQPAAFSFVSIRR